MIYNSKSLNFFKEKGLIIEDKVISNLSKNEMLVKVQSCGICGSDIKILRYGNSRVTSGRTMGHEISGEIVDVGDKIKWSLALLCSSKFCPTIPDAPVIKIFRIICPKVLMK